MKIVNIQEENLHIFSTTRGILRKDVTYDNVKSQKKKKTRLHPLSEKYFFGKTTAFLGLKRIKILNFVLSYFKKMILQITYIVLVFDLLNPRYSNHQYLKEKEKHQELFLKFPSYSNVCNFFIYLVFYMLYHESIFSIYIKFDNPSVKYSLSNLN